MAKRSFVLSAAAAAAVGAMLAGRPARAGSTNYTGPSGSWGTAANWSANAVPAAGDDVSISTSVTGRTVTLDRDYTGTGPLHLLQLSNNTLNLGGHTVRTQQLSFTNGGLIMGGGSGLLAPGIDGVSNAFGKGNGAAGPALNTSGTGVLTFTGGTLDLSGGSGGASAPSNFGDGGGGGALTLGATSNVTLPTGSSILLRGGAGGGAGTTFGMLAGAGGNGGAVRVNPGASFTFAGGTLDVRGGAGRVDGVGNNLSAGAGGTLSLQGGTLTGTSTAIGSTGGTFAFTAGTLHLTDTAPVAWGAGVLGASQASFTFNTGDALVADNGLTLAAGAPAITLAGGAIRAPGKPVTIPSTAAFTFNSGAIELGGGTQSAGAMGTGVLNGIAGGTLTLGRAVTLDATRSLHLTGGAGAASFIAGAGSGGHGGAIELTPGGRITLAAGTLDLSGGKGSDSNSTTPAGNGAAGGSVTVDGGAQLSLTGGTLKLSGGGGGAGQSVAGFVIFPPGATGAAGAIELSGGTLDFATAASTLNGNLHFNSGTLHLTDTAPVTLTPTALHFTQTSITLAGGDALKSDAPVTLSSSLPVTLNGGTLAARSKDLAVPSDASLTFTAGAIDLSGVPVGDGSAAGNGGTLTLGVPVTLDATHTLLLAGANAIGGAAGSPGGKSGNLAVNSGGQVTLAAGTLALTGGKALSISAAPAKGGDGGNVTISSGAIFTFGGGTLDLKGGLSVNGAAPTTNGTLSLAGGTLNVATPSFNLNNGNFAFNSGTLHLTDTSPVTLTAAALHAGQAALTFHAGDALVSDASLTLGPTPGIVLAGGTLQANSKSLTVAADAALTFTSGTIDLSGGGPLPAVPATGGATGNAGGTLALERPLTLDANRSLLLTGGAGLAGHALEPGGGGPGGSVVLNRGGNLTLAAGTLSLAGGTGSLGRPNGGNGGPGGAVRVNAGGELNLTGGTLNLAGGAGGPFVAGFGTGHAGANGTPGSILLTGGVVTADPSAVAVVGGGSFVFGSGTLHVTGAAGLTVGASNVFNRGLGGNNATLAAQQSLIVDGTLTVPSGSAFHRTGPLTVGALAIPSGGTFFGDTAFANTTVANNGDFRDTLSAGPNATVSGSGRFGGLTLGAGGAATLTAGGAQQVVNLTVNSGGKATVSTGALKVGDGVVAAPLAIASDATNTGVVDVTSRGMVVDYAAANESTVLQTVRSNLVRGYHGGAWDGPGIVSSNAATDAGKAVGYALSRDVPGAAGGSFLGQSVDDTSVLVGYTLSGDATLDGTVDFNDLVKLAQNYNTADGSRAWSEGDFNYDGNVDFNDLVKLAQNYNGALPTSAAAALPAMTSGGAFASDLAAALASVPEPGAIAILALAALGGLGRRRRIKEERLTGSRLQPFAS